MKAIRQKLIFLASLCSIGLLASLIVYVNDFVILMIDTKKVFALLFMISIMLIGFFVREYGRYSTAKLITENEIMHFLIAQSEQSSKDNIELIISCFGILLGSKVIKFNIDGIKLKGVEIGCDFICFAYGKNEKDKKIRLLHSIINKDEINKISEGFRYETGIIPIVTD